MNHIVIVVSLTTAGFLIGITWILFTKTCFAVRDRWVANRGRPNRPTDVVDLAGILLSVSIVCGYLLIVVLGVLRWANHYPEWRDSSDFLWYGIVAAAVAMRLLKQWQGRW